MINVSIVKLAPLGGENVTGPAKINHMNTNYTRLYFCYYLQFRVYYSVSVTFIRKPIKFYSTEKTFVVLLLIVIKLRWSKYGKN